MADAEMNSIEIDLSGDGGVLKQILEEGSGDELPFPGCKVSLHYTGTLLDGTKFDSSLDRNVPFEFDLGKGAVIKAFDLGVATMKKGEKCILTCAPQYAYGETGSGPNIPPNSTLKFELEMIEWEAEDLSPKQNRAIERFIVKPSDKKRTPNEGANVNIHIIGKYEGRIFDEREVTFDLGEGSEANVIAGIEIALEKFHQYETSRLIIKPEYAFGAEGNKEFDIPPNATVEYTVTLKKFEGLPESWKLDDNERLVLVKTYKEKGTNYLKMEKYKLALKMYEISNNNLSNNEFDGSKELKIAVHLNKALCYQKMNEPFEAKTACNVVLKNDKDNVKALYRRGQSYLALGELENALADFNRVQELEPNNKAAQNQITICKQKLKEAHEKEKKIYANMFSKFAEVDKKKEEYERSHQNPWNSQINEWSEEDSMKNVHPNIVMLNGDDVK